MRDRLTNAQELFQHPNLVKDGYRVTSPRDKRYNCAAWAAGDEHTEKWWEPQEPLNKRGYFWPEGITPSLQLDSYVQVFKTFGFSECDNGDLEEGFEKIAIYEDAEGDFSHAARQLQTGKWTSKLGPNEDIEHATPYGISGGLYGVFAKFLKRQFKPRVS